MISSCDSEHGHCEDANNSWILKKEPRYPLEPMVYKNVPKNPFSTYSKLLFFLVDKKKNPNSNSPNYK